MCARSQHTAVIYSCCLYGDPGGNRPMRLGSSSSLTSLSIWYLIRKVNNRAMIGYWIMQSGKACSGILSPSLNMPQCISGFVHMV